MSIDARDVFILAVAVIFALAAWSLRPQQRRAENSRWYIGGANDGFFRLLFASDGLPRKYAWCFPAVFALVVIAAVWFFFPAGGT